jgi:hypothetical protein
MQKLVIIMTIFILPLGLSVIHAPTFTLNEASARKYSNHFEQAASLVNDCSGDDGGGIICVNDNPQTQGEENIVNTPVNSQIFNPVKEGPKQELEVRTVLGDEVTVPREESGTSIASCDPDEKVTGGGSKVIPAVGSSLNWRLEHFALGNSYRVSVFNPGMPLVTIQAEAECAKLVDVP